MKFANQLSKFITQAQTNNLRTKDYIKTYEGLTVKVSFGQGAAARVPWISFLKNGQTTSNGIYPVYLFYKEEKLLVLAYGISETNKPTISWNIKNAKTVEEDFKQHGKKPVRYGSSYVFNIYNVNELPEQWQLDSDLSLLIAEYKKALSSESLESKTESTMKTIVSSLIQDQRKAGLLFPSLLITRFIASLLTKPFLILTGLSGSGKTKLAQSFVEWISQGASQYEIVPVGADWTNREPLLGFPNALDNAQYVKPDSGVLNLILRAIKNPGLPYFLILDEMNLSHVERYFADFLSVMESKDVIKLHSNQEESENGVPSEVALPPNLFIIGTVNVDETTYMFSPKVLDRANTIEFRINETEMAEFLRSNKPLDMSAITSKGANMAVDFLTKSKNKNGTIDSDINAVLIRFFNELKRAGAEFGYRSANEIQLLISQLAVVESSLESNTKMDIAIMQKLLPKLHGSRRKLESILLTLGKMCLVSDLKEEDFKKQYFAKELPNFGNEAEIKYPLSLEKICRMHQGAIDHGFASYAEA